MWRIESIPPSYLFGTIHVPYEEVWNDIPFYVKNAFEASQKVYTEIELTKNLTVLQSCQLLPNNIALKSVIPSELYDKLHNLIDKIKSEFPSWLPEYKKPYADEIFTAILGPWQRKKPLWVSFMLNLITKSMFSGGPTLDLHISNVAKYQQKVVLGIETELEHCAALNQLQDNSLVSFNIKVDTFC